MNRVRLSLLAGLCLWAWAGAAAEEGALIDRSGMTLHKSLKLFLSERKEFLSRDNLALAQFFGGYLLGKSEQLDGDVFERIDIPPGVTLEQVCRVVIKWCDDNPQALHNTADVIVKKALQQAFPMIPEPPSN